MHRIVLAVSVLMLSACAQIKPYTYTAQSDNDPQITFGDRFGGGKISSPARTFDVNFNDAVGNKCNDFVNVGTTSNHWMHVVPKTKVIRTPAGKPVAVRSLWGFSGSSCRPGVIMFTPENGEKYSIDIAFVSDKCYLSIVQVKPDGKFEEVKQKAILPDCTN